MAPCSKRPEGACRLAEVLIDSLLEAGDLLSEVVDLVFEVLFPAADAGVAGFDDGAEAVYGPDDRSAQETRGEVEAAERRFAGRTRGRSGGEGPDGETAEGPDGRPEHEFGGSFAQDQRPPGSFELRRRKFSTALVTQGSRTGGGLY